MSVRHKIQESEGVYFITFTCYKWLPLFEIIDGYDIIYQQFDYLKSCGHHIIGYTIMPNHVHAVIAFCNTGQAINTIVGNMKRFIAYEIVNRLQKKKELRLLKKLAEGVDSRDKKRGKLHEVFEPSFDIKELYTGKFIDQKLDYMHNNPCSGKWRMVERPEDYLHSSAKFYLTGEQGMYEVLNYMELEDIDLTIPPVFDAESPTKISRKFFLLQGSEGKSSKGDSATT